MEDLSLHILDIAENSINGAAKTIEIIIDEDRDKDLLTIEIKDDGKGMEAAMHLRVRVKSKTAGSMGTLTFL